MTNLSNHRVSLVAAALTETSWVDVDVRHNLKPSPSTMLPKPAKPSAVDHHNPGAQSVRIDIVVENELVDAPHLFLSA